MTEAELCELCELDSAVTTMRCGIPVCADCLRQHKFEGCSECEYDEELEHGDMLRNEGAIEEALRE